MRRLCKGSCGVGAGAIGATSTAGAGGTVGAAEAIGEGALGDALVEVWRGADADADAATGERAGKGAGAVSAGGFSAVAAGGVTGKSAACGLAAALGRLSSASFPLRAREPTPATTAAMPAAPTTHASATLRRDEAKTVRPSGAMVCDAGRSPEAWGVCGTESAVEDSPAAWMMPATFSTEALACLGANGRSPSAISATFR